MAALIAAAPLIGAASSLAGALMGPSKPKAPPPLAAPTPLPQPSTDDSADSRSLQSSLFAKQAASGRASTLIQPGSSAGGSNPGFTGSTTSGGG